LAFPTYAWANSQWKIYTYIDRDDAGPRFENNLPAHWNWKYLHSLAFVWMLFYTCICIVTVYVLATRWRSYASVFFKAQLWRLL